MQVAEDTPRRGSLNHDDQFWRECRTSLALAGHPVLNHRWCRERTQPDGRQSAVIW